MADALSLEFLRRDCCRTCARRRGHDSAARLPALIDPWIYNDYVNLAPRRPAKLGAGSLWERRTVWGLPAGIWAPSHQHHRSQKTWSAVQQKYQTSALTLFEFFSLDQSFSSSCKTDKLTLTEIASLNKKFRLWPCFLKVNFKKTFGVSGKSFLSLTGLELLNQVSRSIGQKGAA